MSRAPDLAQIRFDNAMALFEEFVHNTIKHPDAATLRGLEGRFAEKVQIQPSYWSQIKGRSRQIGERLARQFEQLCRKPNGWMDQPHGEFANATSASTSASTSGAVPAPGQLTQVVALPNDNPTPQDDDERFIVGLVLTYYRRHPQRARTQLLDILGEVLAPLENRAGGAQSTVKPVGLSAVKSTVSASKTDVSTADIHALWLNAQVGVAPLRRKK